MGDEWIVLCQADDLTVEEPHIQCRRSLGKMIKDRALVDAITTPGPVQNQHGHSALETDQQFTLRWRKCDASVHRIPS